MKYAKLPFTFCQLIWKLISIAFFVVITTNCATPQKEISLSEASPAYSQFQNTELDPFKDQPKEKAPISGEYKYDNFFEESKESYVSTRFAEKVIQSFEEKKARGEDTTKEMEAINQLAENIPKEVKEAVELTAKGKELSERTTEDFRNSPRKAAVVASEIPSTLEELNYVVQNGPKVVEQIMSIKRNADNYSEEKQAAKKEPEPAPAQESANKKKTSLLESKPKTVLTPEQKEEKEYEEKQNRGLLDVFKAEAERSPARLVRILTRHEIPKVRAAAALALGRLKSGRKDLEGSIDRDGFVVRNASYKGLAEIGDRRSLSYFLSGAESDDPEIVAAAMRGLGNVKDPVSRAAIEKFGLSSNVVPVLAESLKAIAKFHNPADVETISRYLPAQEPELQVSAFEALAIHDTKPSLNLLEKSIQDYPDKWELILESIAKQKSLSATFSLVRISQIENRPEVTEKVGQLLAERKAYGRYALVIVENDFIRSEPNERAREVAGVSLYDVGKIVATNPKRYVIRIGDELFEDFYYQILVESTKESGAGKLSRGWIFAKKVQIVSIENPNVSTRRIPRERTDISTRSLPPQQRKVHENLFESKSSIPAKNKQSEGGQGAADPAPVEKPSEVKPETPAESQ